MRTMNEQIIYVSRAAPGVGDSEAFNIIRVAHNRNSQFGLTGALILLDGYFLQVIEGDAWQLKARFEAIARDPRHTDLQVRARGPVQAPDFPGHWMALRHGDAIGPALRQRFGYVPGFGAVQMAPRQLLAFAQACCDEALAAV